jgi:exopolyphosphatase/guanosine-5'-triphosphate,3'-diphosphate pyrophosphatase
MLASADCCTVWRPVARRFSGRKVAQMSHERPADFAAEVQRWGMEIAVLDLGSTTFHLQHIRVDGDAQFTTSLDEKRSICLGAQVFVDGFLNRRSWLEGLNAVRDLLALSRTREPEHTIVVATSAIRSATNGARLVRDIECRYGVSVCVLEPEDEARLAYLGQSTSPVVGGRRVAVIDLGGGSVEIAVGEGARCVHAVSLPIGAVRVRATQSRAAYDHSDARHVATLLREQAADALRTVRELTPEIVVFGSGSARAARKLLMRSSAAPGKTGPIVTNQFRSLLTGLLDHSPEQLVELGVEPARASTVLVSATIMVQMLDMLGVDEALVSDKGLRDGVALEAYRDQLRRVRPLQRSTAFV